MPWHRLPLLLLHLLLLTLHLFTPCNSAGRHSMKQVDEEDVRWATSFALRHVNALASSGPPVWSLLRLINSRITRHYDGLHIERSIIRDLQVPDGRNGFVTVPTSFPSVAYEWTLLDTSVSLTLLLHSSSNGGEELNVTMTVSRDSQNHTAIAALTTGGGESTRVSSSSNIIHRLQQATEEIAAVLVSVMPDNVWNSNDFHWNDSQHTQRTEGSGVWQSSILSVLVVNLWNYNYWEERKPLLSSLLSQLSPSVILFQEVRSRKWQPPSSSPSSSRYQIADLSSMLPSYEFVYSPAMGFFEWGERGYHQEGLAIFSRHPVVSSHFLPLSRSPSDPDDFHQRGLLHLRLSSPLGVLNFLTSHFSLSASARQRNVKEIIEYCNHLEGPLVLGGDFNAEWDDRTLHGLREGGLLDGWIERNGRVGPEKEEERDGWTFRSWEPQSRIDYLMLRGITVKDIRIEGRHNVSMPDIKPMGGVQDMQGLLFPSDHLFLYAKLGMEEEKMNNAGN